MPNSPELDWSGKRCGHNYLPAECPHARCGYREALGEVGRLRAGLAPFAEFARAWRAKPIRGIDESELYSIHGGRQEKLGASISLTDLERARLLIDGQQPQAPDDLRERGGGEV